ncbi:hypothetical protein NYE69_20875 [Paenibacillus sp. FSL R5-0527]|uniref:hypothetical protein n=1 Tax=Paenibacillus sp. FSL R5-0527 TaxID=2975321 RepID=UPI0026B150AD
MGRISVGMKLVVLFLLTASLVSCSPTYSKISDKSPDKNIDLSDYLSITYTKYTNGTDTNDGMTMEVYSYEIGSKKLTKVTELPYTSQYPLSSASLPEQKIYYSAEGERDEDELFAYDLKTQSSEQLSSNLFAINRIIPFTADNKLIMVAVKRGEINLKVGFFDKKGGDIRFVDDQDLDTHTWDIAYNPETDKTYAAQYSDAQKRIQMKKANMANTDMIPSNHWIIEIDNATLATRKIIELKAEKILSITVSGDQILIATAKVINSGPVEYSMVNIQSGERTKLDLPITARKGIYLSRDGKGIYYLGEDKNAKTDQRGIFYLDLKTKKSEPIFLQEDGFINNFSFIRPGSK